MSSLDLARAQMQHTIDKGRASAAAVLEHVHTKIPSDSVARGRALGFRFAAPGTLDTVHLQDAAGMTDERGESVIINACLDQNASQTEPDPTHVPQLLLDVADQTSVSLHRHALGQMCVKGNIPTKYLRELVGSPNQALREAGLMLLRVHYGDTERSDGRYLLRSVDGELRGFLSDRYRRLDSRPLLETFAASCASLGAVPVEGTVGSTRIAMKAYMPVVYEPIPGEFVLIGLEWANSDFGNGTHSLRISLLRLWCTNGCTFQDAIRDIHLGRRLDDDVAYSQRTYDLDTEAARSVMGDVIAHHLSPDAIDKTMSAIGAAHETTISRDSFAKTVRKALGKGDSLRVLDAFDNDNDVEHLPTGGPTLWRASNALSWIAGQTQDGDRSLAMNRMAGKLIEDHLGSVTSVAAKSSVRAA